MKRNYGKCENVSATVHNTLTRKLKTRQATAVSSYVTEGRLQSQCLASFGLFEVAVIKHRHVMRAEEITLPCGMKFCGSLISRIAVFFIYIFRGEIGFLDFTTGNKLSWISHWHLTYETCIEQQQVQYCLVYATYNSSYRKGLLLYSVWAGRNTQSTFFSFLFFVLFDR